MSWRDRDYDSVFDNPGTTRGVAGYWPRGVTLVLLIVHTVAFVLVAAGMRGQAHDRRPRLWAPIRRA